ncbi:MAG TPA: methionyl-tRNA formyltransferase [Flavitalea sp.]|nr:methionyl-tRNA formyltransferase [Flavitalea sp.]
MRIVFMGTPEFAVASLRGLVEAGFSIAGVITAPDKPAGRGLKINESAVKIYALQHGLNILQPEKLKDPEFLLSLKDLHADIQVVVAFRMLPEVVWNMPPLGTINLHGSLLPKYRGAAPINWAVINGEKETGVTTFKLQHEIDTGNILLQKKFDISEDETAGDVHDRMKIIGAELLVETLKRITDNNIQEQPQPSAENILHAPKIFTETCRIDWKKNVKTIYNLVRGLSPYPGAFTMLEGKTLKILKAEKIISAVREEPGTFLTDGRTFLKFAASDGYLNVLDLQLEGKKKMQVQEFLRGFRPKKN